MFFLYSIAIHDKDKQKILSLVDFVTTSHSTVNITKYLTSFRNLLTGPRESTQINIAPIVVTDQSWALINAVQESFNKCNIHHYLSWCYQVLIVESSNNLLRFLIF